MMRNNGETDFETPESREPENKSRFWIGPDIKIDHDTVLKPGASVIDSIAVHADELPPQDEKRLFFYPSLSVRSALAQMGVEAGVFWNQFNEDELMAKGEARLPISLTNYGHRAVSLEPGDGIFRFFDQGKNAQWLTSSELANYVAGNEIIKGDYGQDWWFADKNGAWLSPLETSRAMTICLAFDPDKRLWVPPDENPLHVVNKAELEQYLQPMPPNIAATFFVSETKAQVQMAAKIGLIFSAVEDSTGHYQTMSTIIDPQFGRQSGGEPIRVEIFDPAGQAKNKPHTYLTIYN